MKVLHVAYSLPGGIATYLEEIIPSQIAAYGIDNVRLLAPAGQLRHVASLPPEICVALPEPRRSPRSALAWLLAVRRAIRHEQPALLHLHSSFAGALCRLPYLFARTRPRIVYCAHGWSFTMQVSSWRRRLFGAVERVLSRVTDAVICISSNELAAAIDAGLPPARMRLVRHGIAHGTSRARVTGRAPLSLLFVGRYDRQKGLDILLQAMDLLGDVPVHLIVAGGYVVDGAGAATAEQANVTFAGWQTRAAATLLMQQCDAVVMPSRWEGFGLVAVEAMRAGRAVIASDAGALPEVVVDGVTGRIFTNGSADGLAEAIRTTGREMLARMGAAGRRRYLEDFRSTRMADETSGIYAAVVAQTPRRARVVLQERAA